jgi:DGQHR domain-containing protein
MNKKLFHSGAILTDRDELYDELAIREKKFEKKSVPIDMPLEDGWEPKKEYTHRKQIIKYKSVSRLLEDNVWKLFYSSGMSYMNTRHLILYEIISGVKREIDVLAADEDFVLLIECTTKKTIGEKDDLKEKLDVTKSKFNGVAGTIRELFPNQKPIEIFVTRNIEWTDTQKKVAKSHGFTVLNEYMIEYLFDLVKIAGEGAKYQIFGRLLRNKNIKMKNLSFTVPAIESRMGGKKYWTFNIEPEKLLKISYVNKRKDSDFEDLAMSYQRVMKPQRIVEIKKYIGENNGFFPNTIIVNFEKPFKTITPLGTDVQKNKWSVHTSSKPVVITTPERLGCAWIIDGQHRLYGYADTDAKYSETVPVVAFSEFDDVSFEAKVFMDINEKQTPVSANLRWDLYEDLYADSNIRKESDLFKISVIAKNLNKKGPLKNQIEIPKISGDRHITLNYICSAIKRSNLVGKNGHFSPENNTLSENIKYATERFNIYFKVLSELLPEQWKAQNNHFINAKPGMYLFITLLKDFIPKLIDRDEYHNLKKFERALNKRLFEMCAYIDTFNKKKIEQFSKASTFAALPPAQVELIKEIQKHHSYSSDIIKKINEKATKPFEVTKPGLMKLLDEGENYQFEVKGSVSMDINDFLYKGKSDIKNDERVNDILFAIASLLNFDGGTIAIGILENDKYLQKLEEKKINFEKINNVFSAIGIENEKKNFKRGWDDLQSYINNKIMSQITPSPRGLIKIKILRNMFEDISPVIISVATGNDWHYVENKITKKSNGQNYKYPQGELFFYRESNAKQLLQGKELEHYLRNHDR